MSRHSVHSITGKATMQYDTDSNYSESNSCKQDGNNAFVRIWLEYCRLCKCIVTVCFA